jgi:HEAT repeat protein
MSAAEALGNIGTPDAIELLKEALKDPDRFVRNIAFSALLKICKKSPISIHPQDVS